jgi:hypothetical protein
MCRRTFLLAILVTAGLFGCGSEAPTPGAPILGTQLACESFETSGVKIVGISVKEGSCSEASDLAASVLECLMSSDEDCRATLAEKTWICAGASQKVACGDGEDAEVRFRIRPM